MTLRLASGLRFHPATYIAAAALVVAVSDVSPADAVSSVKRALFADNAAKVNGIKASKTPRAGRLVPLDAQAKFPASVLQNGRGPRGAQGPGGPVGPAGPAGPRGPSSARLVAPESTSLSRLDSVYVTVATLPDVAAGAYLAIFTGGAYYRVDGDRMIATCEMRVNGAGVASTRALVGEVAGSAGGVPLSTVAAIDRPANFALTVACRPSENAVTDQVPVSIENVKLVVVRLDSVTTG